MLTAIRALAWCWPFPVAADPALDRALAFLGSEIAPETLVGAGYTLTCVLAAGGAVLALVAGPFAFAVGCLAGICVAGGTPAVPKLLATARRNVALATAPDLVCYAVLRATLEPSTEAAAAFAADAGSGPLAASLHAHVGHARGTGASGIEAFTEEWTDWLPALGRAFALIGAATAAPPAERARTLDRARQTVLDGVRERTATFAAALRGPATALYAFGVLLPLALVAGLPAARAAGLGLSLPVIAVGYCLLLPAGLLAASAWLLARRPATFPVEPVSSGYWQPLAAGAATAVGCWLFAPLLLPAWTRPVVALSGGASIALLVWATPAVALRERVQAVEAGLPDALALIGQRVSDGAPVETAMAEVSEELTDETGALLADAVARQHRLGVGVRGSLLGRSGVLATLPSTRGRSAAVMLSVAATEGEPAGAALVAMADHLDDLQRLDSETRRELRQVTGTLANTASVFGPLVAGAAVALAAGIGAQAPGTPLSTAGLGTVLGCYTLVLAAVLAALAAGLEVGVDPPRMAKQAGRALLSATVIYLAAFVGAGALT